MNALPSVDAGPDIAICIGDSLILNGAGAVSYLWDNGVVDGVSFSPLSTATYNVTGTDTNQCKNTFQLNLTITPLGISIDTAIICQGDSLSLIHI